MEDNDIYGPLPSSYAQSQNRMEEQRFNGHARVVPFTGLPDSSSNGSNLNNNTTNLNTYDANLNNNPTNLYNETSNMVPENANPPGEQRRMSYAQWAAFSSRGKNPSSSADVYSTYVFHSSGVNYNALMIENVQI